MVKSGPKLSTPSPILSTQEIEKLSEPMAKKETSKVIINQKGSHPMFFMDEFFQTVKEQIIPRNIDTWGDIEKYTELPNLFYKANIALDDIQGRQQKQ